MKSPKSLFAALLLFVPFATLAVPLDIDFTRSQITVLVKATAHSFTGRLEKFNAVIECGPQTPMPRKADVSFSFTDLKTGNTNRDAAMIKWVDYTNTPVTYHLSGWTQNGATNIALGSLTIRGVSREVDMPVVVQHNGEMWDISGEAEFDHRDFNLPRIRKALVLTVDPRLKVTFHLVGKLSGEK